MNNLAITSKYGITVVVRDCGGYENYTAIGPDGFLIQGEIGTDQLEDGLLLHLNMCEDMEDVGNTMSECGVKILLNNTSYNF